MTLWADRLRSTTYEQTFHEFGSGNSRCALGVIGDMDNDSFLTSINGWRLREEIHGLFGRCEHFYKELVSKEVVTYKHHSTFLSDYVMHLNDEHKLSFNEIANIIEPIELEHRMTQNDPEPEKEEVFA